MNYQYLNETINNIKTLKIQLKEQMVTIDLLKNNEIKQQKACFTPIGDFALLPSKFTDIDPLVSLSSEFLVQEPKNLVISRLEKRADEIQNEIDSLKFKYLPQDLLSEEQTQVVEDLLLVSNEQYDFTKVFLQKDSSSYNIRIKESIIPKVIQPGKRTSKFAITKLGGD